MHAGQPKTKGKYFGNLQRMVLLDGLESVPPVVVIFDLFEHGIVVDLQNLSAVVEGD